MANKEHLKIIQSGVAKWNEWRRKNHDIKPDLRQIKLSQVSLSSDDIDPHLSHIDLHDSILYETDLTGTNLTRANLRGADLRGARLAGANLQEADLNKSLLMGINLRSANLNSTTLLEANLKKANLQGADLRDAELSGAALPGAILDGADLSRATMRRTYFKEASLVGTNLSKCHMSNAELISTNLQGANLADAHLRGAFIFDTNLSGTNLTGANLMYARLVESNLERADLSDCSIYGISAWNLELTGTEQTNLVITRPDEPTITVDNLEVGQFIYMLLNNQKIRDVINTITSKTVLILGSFSPERKEALDALREELRKHNYLPILFDFARPSNRNLTETISTLAHIARFVIADITGASSIPQELQRIVPTLPSLPVQPILQSSNYEYGMFRDLTDYPWFLEPYRYEGTEELLLALEEKVISPAAIMARKIEKKRKGLEGTLR